MERLAACSLRQDFVATVGSGAPDVPREMERLDPTDTGVMASRHLEPFVSKRKKGNTKGQSASLQLALAIP